MQSDDIYEAQDVDDMSGEATGEFDNGTPSEEELQSIVGSALDDAVDFIDNTISPLRATSIDYYQGKPFGNEEDGRSQVISLDVHDTIADILPSLMRIFFSSENVVEFVPFGKEDVKLAEQATDYINRIVLQQDNDGFPIFYNAFKDALLCKNGILKYYWDTTYHAEYYEYSRLSDNELTVLEADDEVEITEVVSYPDPAFPQPQGSICYIDSGHSKNGAEILDPFSLLSVKTSMTYNVSNCDDNKYTVMPGGAYQTLRITNRLDTEPYTFCITMI